MSALLVTVASVGVVCYIFRREVMSILSLLKKKAVFKLHTALTRPKLSRVIYIDSLQECETIIKKYFLHQQVLGLDCEWVTIGTHRSPVSLLQLASPAGICALFRLQKLFTFNPISQTHSIPQTLEELLNDTRIIKVGVAIQNDYKYLAEDYNVQMSSWLDLRHLALENDVPTRGLAYLAKETMDITLDKTFNIRVSNWDAETLTEEQKHYAAMDAYAAISIFTYFAALKQSLLGLLFSPPDYVTYTQSIQNLTEVPFKDKHNQSSRTAKHSKINTARRNYSTLTYDATQNNKESCRRKNKDTPWRGFRPGKVYDNCYLLDPQNRVLCTCERKKAQWYLDKSLGVQVKQEPFTIRLLFQPQDFDREDCKYYASEKENRCVVCGEKEQKILIKKYIVPHEYRRHMPDHMKDRRSHDVLLMCYRCHKRSNMKDQVLRKTLAIECSAPIEENKSDFDMETNKIVRRVKSAALALTRHQTTNQLPLSRLEELQSILSAFYKEQPGCLDWTSEQCLEHATSQLQENHHNPLSIPHGQAVIGYYHDRDELVEFETRWRQHFLSTMRPAFLPEHWSLTHNNMEVRRKKAKVTKTGGDSPVDLTSEEVKLTNGTRHNSQSSSPR